MPADSEQSGNQTPFERLLLLDSARPQPQLTHDELQSPIEGLPLALLDDYLRQHPDRAQAAAQSIATAREQARDNPSGYQTALNTTRDQLVAEARLAYTVEDGPRITSTILGELDLYMKSIEALPAPPERA